MIALPILFMTVWCAVVAAAAIVDFKLRRLMRERWAADLPVIFQTRERNPEKLRYVFSEETRARFEADPQLWRLRQALGFLLVSALVMWLCGLAAISGAGLVVALMKHTHG